MAQIPETRINTGFLGVTKGGTKTGKVEQKGGTKDCSLRKGWMIWS